ncbi:hypothetical protein GCM10009753_23580 [Streptantibioticus ferralitis]
MIRGAGAGQCPYNHQATWGQLGQSFANEVSKAALHAVPFDGTAHGLAHDETRTRRGSTPPRSVRVRDVSQVHDE